MGDYYRESLFLCAVLPTTGFGSDQGGLEKVLDAVDASPGIELQRIQYQIKSLQVDDSKRTEPGR